MELSRYNNSASYGSFPEQPSRKFDLQSVGSLQKSPLFHRTERRVKESIIVDEEDVQFEDLDSSRFFLPEQDTDRSQKVQKQTKYEIEESMLQDIEDERDYKRLIRMKELEVELKERINALKVERSVFRKQLKCLDKKFKDLRGLALYWNDEFRLLAEQVKEMRTHKSQKSARREYNEQMEQIQRNAYNILVTRSVDHLVAYFSNSMLESMSIVDLIQQNKVIYNLNGLVVRYLQTDIYAEFKQMDYILDQGKKSLYGSFKINDKTEIERTIDQAADFWRLDPNLAILTDQYLNILTPISDLGSLYKANLAKRNPHNLVMLYIFQNYHRDLVTLSYSQKAMIKFRGQDDNKREKEEKPLTARRLAIRMKKRNKGLLKYDESNLNEINAFKRMRLCIGAGLLSSFPAFILGIVFLAIVLLFAFYPNNIKSNYWYSTLIGQILSKGDESSLQFKDVKTLPQFYQQALSAFSQPVNSLSEVRFFSAVFSSSLHESICPRITHCAECCLAAIEKPDIVVDSQQISYNSANSNNLDITLRGKFCSELGQGYVIRTDQSEFSSIVQKLRYNKILNEVYTKDITLQTNFYLYDSDMNVSTAQVFQRNNFGTFEFSRARFIVYSPSLLINTFYEVVYIAFLLAILAITIFLLIRFIKFTIFTLRACQGQNHQYKGEYRRYWLWRMLLSGALFAFYVFYFFLILSAYISVQLEEQNSSPKNTDSNTLAQTSSILYTFRAVGFILAIIHLARFAVISFHMSGYLQIFLKLKYHAFFLLVALLLYFSIFTFLLCFIFPYSTSSDKNYLTTAMFLLHPPKSFNLQSSSNSLHVLLVLMTVFGIFHLVLYQLPVAYIFQEARLLGEYKNEIREWRDKISRIKICKRWIYNCKPKKKTKRKIKKNRVQALNKV